MDMFSAASTYVNVLKGYRAAPGAPSAPPRSCPGWAVLEYSAGNKFAAILLMYS